MHKIVDGEVIELTKDEEAEILRQWEAEESTRLSTIKEEVNKEILIKLKELDLKSIRALRTNDINRLQEYEQEAIALRQQLI